LVNDERGRFLQIAKTHLKHEKERYLSPMKSIQLNDEHLCVGLWTSRINGRDNGAIVIPFPPDPITGVFSGTHFVPDGTRVVPLQIHGTCEHPGAGGGGAHFIQFRETTENLETFVYSGVIVPDASAAHRHKVPNGKRENFLIDLKEGRAELHAEDEWTAEKVT
jgi:hypothetical protein